MDNILNKKVLTNFHYSIKIILFVGLDRKMSKGTLKFSVPFDSL